jgi:hypothetical protein
VVQEKTALFGIGVLRNLMISKRYTKMSIPDNANGTTFTTKFPYPDQLKGDGFANNNGLCENNEKCIMTANFGSYLGDGLLQESYIFIGAGISGIKMRAYSQYYGN